MSNSLQILCIKDTEGYWTEGEMYPARVVAGGLSHISCRSMKTTPQNGQAWRGYEHALAVIIASNY
ncbi:MULTISPECIES: hypothetical protein [Klebsiella]|uniref:hypothetical protein n=1 Tax=Klebsiella TaxID=570 RepID=UPI001E3EAB4C|nr:MULTISPECIES: hypothetical protein [Klebsiella]MEC6162726.1 hypothetical protein [Klebsiella grimontii]UHC97786.1 hypothetical protein LUW96_18935 [Klebsiella pasteurii]UXO76680.1 hypothetical protein N7918_16815 [Klebsiella michiganensis]